MKDNKKNTKSSNKNVKPVKKAPKAEAAKSTKKVDAKKADSKVAKAETKKKDKDKKDTSLKDVNKKPINKVLMIIIAAVVVILIVVLALFIRKTMLKHKVAKSMNVQLYQNADYPILYNEDGDGIVFTLDGSKTPDLKWDVIIGDEEFVSADAQGEEVDGKAIYNVAPLKGGSTDIHFVRSMNVEDVTVNVVDIKTKLFVEEREDYINLIMDGNIEYVKGPDVIAEDSESPVIINNASSDASADSEYADYDELNGNASEGDIYFVKGSEDWEFESTDGLVDITYYPYGKGEIAYIEKGSGAVKEENPQSGDMPGKEERLGKSKVSEDATPEGQSVEDKKPSPAEGITAGDFTLTNDKLGVTEKFHVEFTDDGVIITKVEDSKKDNKKDK